jgi:L-alanine-DL-glutamate epimerase-like enolase superfamily enzyme
VELFWGCNDESLLSITAALHVAYSCPHTRYIDLDGSFDLASDFFTGGFQLKDGILMIDNTRPGLGVQPLS